MSTKKLLLNSILLTALLCVGLTIGTVRANTLLGVRVGPHKNFDRIVFELEDEAPSRVEMKGNQVVEVQFEHVATPPTFALPSLLPGLMLLKGVQAYRVGDDGIAFEITLSKAASLDKLILPGRPWRLAIDLSASISENPQQDKPEYIPGDQPIPTKLAEQTPLTPTESAPNSTTTDQTEPAKLAAVDTTIQSIPAAPAPVDLANAIPPQVNADSISPEHTDSLNPNKLRAVLAYFYLAVGETSKAQAEANRYRELTGNTLDIAPGFDLNKSNQPSLTIPTPSSTSQSASLPFSMVIGIGFAAGLAGGIIGTYLLTRQKKPRKAKLSAQSVTTPREQADAIEWDLKKLREVVGQQTPTETKTAPQPAPAPAPVKAKAPVAAERPVAAAPAPAPEPEPAPAPTAGEAAEEIKESVMDRRVRRVLELNKEGKNIQAIAQELEMGQDEVKLILDLNQ